MEGSNFVVGRPDSPLKNANEIAEDICRMSCISDNPCSDLAFLIDTCYKLWDMHRIEEKNRVENIILEFKGDHCV